MGRAYEVRKASMAATGAKKSSLYMRASREIYMAAKSGIPDPASNLTLRSAIEKFKGQSIPKDVIERAIKKAAGGEVENYTAGRYEGMGPGGTFLIVESLTTNVTRAFAEIRNVFNKKGGHLGVPGSVSFNFQEVGELVFEASDQEAITEALVMADVDVQEVKKADDTHLDVIVAPTSLAAARDAIIAQGINDFDVCEILLLPNENVAIEGEDAQKLKNLLDALDELEDVQNVYHNADL